MAPLCCRNPRIALPDMPRPTTPRFRSGSPLVEGCNNRGWSSSGPIPSAAPFGNGGEGPLASPTGIRAVGGVTRFTPSWTTGTPVLPSPTAPALNLLSASAAYSVRVWRILVSTIAVTTAARLVLIRFSALVIAPIPASHSASASWKGHERRPVGGGTRRR